MWKYMIFIEGYPPGYHLGFSFFLWTGFILLCLIFGLFLYNKRHKTYLINRKEVFFGTELGLFLGALAHLSILIGVFLINFFEILLNIAFASAALAIMSFLYYWEKNLVNLKKIPTLVASVTLIISLINIFTAAYLSLQLIIQIFWITSFTFFIILFVKFISNVEGNLKKMGFLYIFWIVVFFIAVFTDHPPFIMVFPELFIILSPILFIISFCLLYYTTIKVCDGITTYYNQIKMCTVHRGTISKGNTVYLCPKCNTIYCQRCYEQVIKKDGCWNCRTRGKDNDIKEWEQGEISIVEKVFKDDAKNEKIDQTIFKN